MNSSLQIENEKLYEVAVLVQKKGRVSLCLKTRRTNRS